MNGADALAIPLEAIRVIERTRFPLNLRGFKAQAAQESH